jgi:hypothetical protein
MSATGNQFSLPGGASQERFPAARTACATKLLPLLLLLTLPAVVQAQYYFTTNNGTITITEYYGPGGAVTVPSTINWLPVTCIGYEAFSTCTSLTSVTIPNSVTNIGNSAFYGCTGLVGITIPDSVMSIGAYAFYGCTDLASVTIGSNVTSVGDYAFAGWTALTNVIIPNSVTYVGDSAFWACTNLTSVTIGNNVTDLYWTFSYCTKLTSVTIGNNVTNIGDGTFSECYSLTYITVPSSVTSIGIEAPSECFSFYDCYNLTGIYFKGSIPRVSLGSFSGDINATVYYLPSPSRWPPTFGGLPTVLWNPQVQTGDATFGVRTNRFGFTITGTASLVIMVEACTNLANPTWFPVQTITLTGGPSYFSDPRWTNYAARLYRLRSP